MATDDPVSCLHNLLDEQNLAVLATQSQNHPYTNLIAFSPTDDYKSLIFATVSYTHLTLPTN